MNPKRASSRKPGIQQGSNGRTEVLKSQRLAYEEKQKAAGVWGEMSVGSIERLGTAFVHMWKGVATTDVRKLALKRPKEISKVDHDLLCTWLKAGSYDGFSHSISAWSVSLSEAERIKGEVISRLVAEGSRIINHSAKS